MRTRDVAPEATLLGASADMRKSAGQVRRTRSTWRRRTYSGSGRQRLVCLLLRCTHRCMPSTLETASRTPATWPGKSPRWPWSWLVRPSLRPECTGSCVAQAGLALAKLHTRRTQVTHARDARARCSVQRCGVRLRLVSHGIEANSGPSGGHAKTRRHETFWTRMPQRTRPDVTIFGIFSILYIPLLP